MKKQARLYNGIGWWDFYRTEDGHSFTIRDGKDYWYIDFEHYRKLLRDVKALSDAAPKDSIANKLIMLDNFNEWDEGHFLSPSYRFGFKHLQAIREELSDRDNLPDYRTPADQGFGGYNNSWRTPDFKDFCENLLEKI